MNSIEQQQGQLTFTPLSTVQPSANTLMNGSIVESFAQQQLQQKPWNQSPTSGSAPAASARTIMFGGGNSGQSGPTKLSLPICSGCNQPILDKYVLHVAPDSTWHADCLRCAECSQPLDETCTCYVRNGHAYCKNDYNKLFGVRCARCQKSFSRMDSIMRVRAPTNGGSVLFHTDCFTCFACGCPLLPGSRFALMNGPAPPESPTGEVAFLLCERDFDYRPPFGPAPNAQRVIRPTPLLLSGDSPMMENHHPFGLVNGACPQPQQPGQLLPSMHPMGPTGSDGIVMLDPPQPPVLISPVPGQPQPPGTVVHRPTNANQNKHDPKTCEKTSSVSSCGSASTNGHAARPQVGGRSRESKTTRVRTVLNEKQLNTLRACYAANPRPDALMKEQLVEMTGLSPRVIRVWFQNKRCKDKKKSMLMKLQAQHLSGSDKVAALQSAIPLIAQDAMPHSGGSPVHGSEVPIHSFSQSAWKSLADFAMNADIEPSASFQQFVNGVDGSSKPMARHHRSLQHRGNNSHNQTTSDGISDIDDDDDIDDDEEVLGDDDDDMMVVGSASGSGMGGGCSSTSPAADASLQHLAQRQQLLVDSASATICNRL